MICSFVANRVALYLASHDMTHVACHVAYHLILTMNIFEDDLVIL